MDILLSIRAKADSSTREVRSAIADGLVIGRGAEHGVLLDGPDLSREHLVITSDGTTFYVTDLSSNGTWVNGTRLKRSVRSQVTTEDLIEIPGYALSFKQADQVEQIAATPAAKEVPVQAPAPSLPLPATPAKAPSFSAMVFHFIGSFSFLEKFSIAVGIGGLLLLFAYFGS
jgi:predicted component of type VI protein secretion system